MTTAELELPTSSAATLSIGTTMKALVYHGADKCTWDDKPRVTTSTICGTDLHILKGDDTGLMTLMEVVNGESL